MSVNVKNSKKEARYDHQTFGRDPTKQPSDAPRNVGINYQHLLNLEWLTNDKFVLRFGFLNTKNYFGRSISMQNENHSSPRNEVMRFKEWGQYVCNGMSVGFRWHTKQNAPLGTFMEISFGYDWISYDSINIIRPPNTSNSARINLPENYTIPNENLSAPNLGLAWGYTKCLDEQWIFGFTAHFNFVLGNTFGTLPNHLNYGSGGNMNKNTEVVENSILFRYAQQRFF